MHRGRLLKKKLDEAHVNKAQFARNFGYKSEKSLFNVFNNPNASLDIFIFAIKSYKLDFSREMPDLRNDVIDQMNEELTGREKMVPMELHLDVIKKYTAQLEENNSLLRENIDLYRKLGITKNEEHVAFGKNDRKRWEEEWL